MQVLGPSRCCRPRIKPFPGAGEQMRWSYWQAGLAGRLGHRLGQAGRHGSTE